MRKFIHQFALIFIFGLISGQVSAQQPAKDSVKVDPTLRGQYLSLLSKSKSLNGYKVVNPARITSFWQNLNDTLKTERRQLAASRKEITAQQKTIADLKTQVSQKEMALNTSTQKLDEITFLGISFTKGSYNTMVWTIIIILAIALAIIIIRSAKLLHEAKYRSGLYEEISSEYQSYKVKSNEKEKKLARELQDERNKLDEYKSRGH
jgi:tetrahydromethanopterin S-methyltransferase subunit B